MGIFGLLCGGLVELCNTSFEKRAFDGWARDLLWRERGLARG